MAITRCPYCHAIIDENDKYCNNCGTQLLFPEDDEVDEEIPGEKIIDAEVEDKDYTVDEPEDEKRPPAAGDVEEDLDEVLEEEMKEEAAEKALDEIVAEGALEDMTEGATEEVILVDEIEASEEEDRARTGELEDTAAPFEKKEAAGADETHGEEAEEVEEEEEEEAEKEEDVEDEDLEDDEEEKEAGDEERGGRDGDGDDDTTAEIDEEDVSPRAGTETPAPMTDASGPREPAVEAAPAGGDVEVEYLAAPAEGAETEDIPAGTAGESAFRPVTFDTNELENLGRTVEISKQKIDEFVQVLAEKKPAEPPPPAPGPAGAPAPEGPREPTGSLPPWASSMKGAPVFPPDTTPVEPKKGPVATPSAADEVEIFPRRRPSDSTLGLPERLAQAPLPFGTDAEEKGEEEGSGSGAEAGAETDDETRETVRPPLIPVREPARVESAVIEDAEGPAEKPPFSLAVFFKSKVFDLLFVGLFWLVALWLAAHATGQTLFEILNAVSGPMLMLYGVFLLLYVFLFKFFLGETLGDRLFRPRD